MARCWALHQRAIAAMFLFSFVSLAPQVNGLIGPTGISPAEDVIQLTEGLVLWDRVIRFPTVFAFIAPTQTALSGAVTAGALASAISLLGVGSRVPLLVAWVLFLSLATVGGEFLAFPWDGLLLETGALALLLPPSGFLSARTRAPAAAVRFAHRFLAFRLMLGMGLQKFYATEAWRGGWQDGSFLRTFYVWQPMPTTAAWYAHHAGRQFHAMSTRVVFVSQLVLPFGMYGPRRVRRGCAALFVAEQAWIQLTGNYGVFNLLSAALFTFPLVDDWSLLPPRPQEAAQDLTGVLLIAPLVAPLVPSLATSLAIANVVGGCFFMARRLLVGIRESHYPWLSTAEWLFSDSDALASFEATLSRVPDGSGVYGAVRPLLLVALTGLRLAAPFRACNDYGIFRYGLGRSVKPVVSLYGVSGLDGASGPLVLPTSFHQATGGVSAKASTGSLPSFFAPHQPRLDHSFFYAGIDMSIGHHVQHEQHHLVPATRRR